MAVLVTGAAGFIGAATSAALLARGDEVFGIDSVNDYYDPQLKWDRIERLQSAYPNSFRFERVDFSDNDALHEATRAIDLEWIVHLGAQPGVRYSLENPAAYVRSNLVGHANMLEFARALATRPKLLLVDEPAAGLNAAEVDMLLDRIRITRDRGVTVVLVEHNMELVMNVADRVLVMDYGQRLFEGPPGEVQKNEAVVAAYLGGELM